MGQDFNTQIANFAKEAENHAFNWQREANKRRDALKAEKARYDDPSAWGAQQAIAVEKTRLAEARREVAAWNKRAEMAKEGFFLMDAEAANDMGFLGEYNEVYQAATLANRVRWADPDSFGPA